MRPIKKRMRGPDQRFRESERLFKRVPREHLAENGEIEPSLIQCSFNKGVKSAPSVVREKYASPCDTLHPGCAGGNDVSSQVLFYLHVGELPKGIVSGDKKIFDFYAYHEPEDDCYAHSVIASKTIQPPSEDYVQPTSAVKNAFKAKLISALKPVTIPRFPKTILHDFRKCVAAIQQGR